MIKVVDLYRRRSRSDPSSSGSGRRQQEVDGHRHQHGDGRAVDQRRLVPPLLDRGDRCLFELGHGTQYLDVAHLARRVDGRFQDYEALNAGFAGRGGIDWRDIVDLRGRRDPVADPDGLARAAGGTVRIGERGLQLREHALQLFLEGGGPLEELRDAPARRLRRRLLPDRAADRFG